MTDKKTVELLETIQSSYQKIPSTFRVDYLSQHLKEVDEYAQKIRPSFPSTSIHIDKARKINIPSKYQDTLSYLDIYEIFENIVDVKHLFSVDPFKTKFINLENDIPIFGTIPSNRFTALIKAKNEDTNEIILISDGLISFAFYLCSIVACFYPVSKNRPLTLSGLFLEEAFIKEEIKRLNIKEEFYCLILTYFFSKRCPANTLMNDNTIPMTETLVKGFLHFVVAHEYCHFLLGHTFKDNISQPFNDDAQFSLKSKNDELEADLFGAMFSDIILNKNDVQYPLSVFGIDLCLRTFALFEKLNAITHIKDNSHPEYVIRRENLNGFLQRGDTNFLVSIDLIFDLLLEDFDSIIEFILPRIDGTEVNEKMLREEIRKYIS